MKKGESENKDQQDRYNYCGFQKEQSPVRQLKKFSANKSYEKALEYVVSQIVWKSDKVVIQEQEDQGITKFYYYGWPFRYGRLSEKTAR